MTRSYNPLNPTQWQIEKTERILRSSRAVYLVSLQIVGGADREEAKRSFGESSVPIMPSLITGEASAIESSLTPRWPKLSAGGPGTEVKC